MPRTRKLVLKNKPPVRWSNPTSLAWEERATFGPYLRTLRRRTGLSLRAATTKMGISYSYLAKLETGEKRTPPTLKVLDRIARFYTCELGEIMQQAGFDMRLAEGAMKNITQEEQFERLLTCPDLTPERWEPNELNLIPRLVQRQWIDFARKLAVKLTGTSGVVDAILTNPFDGQEG